MTREQAKQALIGMGVAEPSEEQVSKLLDSISAETKKEKDKNVSLKEKAEKADSLEKELEELKKQNMTEAEKAELERQHRLHVPVIRLEAEGIDQQIAAVEHLPRADRVARLVPVADFGGAQPGEGVEKQGRGQQRQRRPCRRLSPLFRDHMKQIREMHWSKLSCPLRMSIWMRR